ncbi:MAG: hypothetical protein L3J67_06495 [Hyphomicrobiaceae bacterium]|nr:hypothetical protein [Hyphomicrobiaceae bacterium]
MPKGKKDPNSPQMTGDHNYSFPPSIILLLISFLTFWSVVLSSLQPPAQSPGTYRSAIISNLGFLDREAPSQKIKIELKSETTHHLSF